MIINLTLIRSMLPEAQQIVETATGQKVGKFVFVKLGRAHRTLGTCGRSPGRTTTGTTPLPRNFILTIHPNSFNVYPNPIHRKAELMKTIIHEYIHTLPNCMNHGQYFQKACAQIKRAFPQYLIMTRHRDNPDTIREDKSALPQYKYVITCTKCGTKTYRQKRTSLFDKLSHCSCGKCGSYGTFTHETLRQPQSNY